MPNYFYLFLLVEDDKNENIVNYKYSIDIIINLNIRLENTNDSIFKNLVASKLILTLIQNYKSLDEYDKQKDEEEFYKIKNNISRKISNYIENLKNLDLYLDEKTIVNDKLDKIYIDIINGLIKSEKFENYDECKGIMEQIEIEKINITKKMYDELSKSLNMDKDNMKKYLISEIKDLLDGKKINFYFILLKYIIKCNIYIYQIPFLLQSRINILKILKSNLKDFPININNNDKLKYIFNFLIDSEYYRKQIPKNNINDNANKEAINNKNSRNNGVKSTKIQTLLTQLSTDIEDNFKVLKFDKIIDRDKKRINHVDFINEISNGCFITGGGEDNLYIYNKDFNYVKMIQFIMPNNYQKNLLTQGSSNRIKTVEFKITQNIIQINNSEKNKINNKIEIIDCSKNGLFQYSIDFNDKNNIITINTSNPFGISCCGYFEINNSYILYGEKGFFDFEKNPLNLEINSDKELLTFIKGENNYKGGIKVNDNLIALTSNQILPNGKDIILFYDISKKTIIKELINYSFVNGVNGLILVDIEKENKKILLCACKKYLQTQKNGILLINPDYIEKKDISEKFIPTDEFEVNCFCQINFIGNKGIIKSNYFFAGGFDNEKREGLIKLYRVVFKKEKEIDIEFLEDIYFDGNDKVTEGFEGTINCIVQSTNNGKILVSCWDKKIYAFSKPNIDYYLEEEEDLGL